MTTALKNLDLSEIKMTTKFLILERIANSGELIFSVKKESEVEEMVDSFLLNTEPFEEGGIDAADTLSYQSDIIVVKARTLDDAETLVSYDFYTNRDKEETNSLLNYNYSMTSDDAEDLFMEVLENVTNEMTPTTSINLDYDFKFSENQRASISGSSGGGY